MASADITLPAAALPAVAGTPAAATPRPGRLVAPAGADEAPVFFDASGRRAPVVRWATGLLAALMPAWLLAVVVGALTPLSLPTLPQSLASTHHSAAHRAAGHAAHHAPAPPDPAELNAAGLSAPA
jgi:hypothetical protein